MKAIVLLILFGIILACNSNKSFNNTSITYKSSSECPNNGICSFEVLKNKSFTISTDEFGNSYTELIDGSKTVLKFMYVRNTDPDVEDADYSEVIYLEIDPNQTNIYLENENLNSVKAGFSRICFCRGQMGTFPVKKGILRLSKLDDDLYNLTFEFTVSEVPQYMTSINETFKL